MAALRGVRIVVVGAGLSGLVAARALTAQGADVHVIEARDRIGGRVWTLRSASLDPFVVEAGGEFIDGGHQAIRSLCRELDLPLVRVLREGFGLALQTERLMKVRPNALWKRFKRALQPLAAAFREGDCDWNTSTAAAIASRSLDGWLAERHATPELRAMAMSFRGFFLADSDQISALVGVELSLEESYPGDVPLYRIRGGNDQLALALVRGLDLRMSGRHVVRAIDQTRGLVRVAVVGPGGVLDYLHCDYVIVTVPTPVILDWELTPPLPSDVRHAMVALTYGPATKAIFRFASCWWRAKGQPRAYGSNLPIGAVWESAEEQRKAAVLSFLAGGSASAALRDLLAREGPLAVAERLRWLGRPTDIEAVEEIDWGRDPWACGGYAYFSRAFPPHLRASLGRAHGRLLFAGDHTSRDYQGYMNGAVESGQRAARELAALHALTKK